MVYIVKCKKRHNKYDGFCDWNKNASGVDCDWLRESNTERTGRILGKEEIGAEPRMKHEISAGR